MQKAEMEQLIAAVAERVLSALNAQASSAPSARQAQTSVLVIGNAQNVPSSLINQAELASLPSYAACGDIKRFGRVIVETLTLAQLADIAMVRPSDEAACAIVQALLQGVEVVLLESALAYRAYANQSNPKLFAVLEGYVRTLEGYGVKVLGKNEALAQSSATACALPKRNVSKPALVTEAVAQAMVAKEQTVHLSRGTILTPSARDVFHDANTVLIWDD